MPELSTVLCKLLGEAMPCALQIGSDPKATSTTFHPQFGLTRSSFPYSGTKGKQDPGGVYDSKDFEVVSKLLWQLLTTQKLFPLSFSLSPTTHTHTHTHSKHMIYAKYTVYKVHIFIYVYIILYIMYMFTLKHTYTYTYTYFIYTEWQRVRPRVGKITLYSEEKFKLLKDFTKSTMNDYHWTKTVSQITILFMNKERCPH